LGWVVALLPVGLSKAVKTQNASAAVAIVTLIGYVLLILFDAITLVWQVGKANRRVEAAIVQDLLRTPRSA
jgi:hypothetical protein